MFRVDGPDGSVAVTRLGAGVRIRPDIAALARLRHPALLPLLDHGGDDELGGFLVTPLVDGVPVRDAVGTRVSPEGAILLAACIASSRPST